MQPPHPPKYNIPPPPWLRSIANIVQEPKYNYHAKFGAFTPECTIFSPYGLTNSWVSFEKIHLTFCSLTFFMAFGSALARILSQIQSWSVSMVTRNDVISRRWSSHFWVKINVFSPFLTREENTVVKIMQSVHLCVVFHLKHKKTPFLAVLTWFQILGFNPRWRSLLVTSQAPSPPATSHVNIPYLVEKIKGFPLNVKSFRNTATYQKL